MPTSEGFSRRKLLSSRLFHASTAPDLVSSYMIWLLQQYLEFEIIHEYLFMNT